MFTFAFVSVKSNVLKGSKNMKLVDDVTDMQSVLYTVVDTGESQSVLLPQ